jgi:hypothetical protein
MTLSETARYLKVAELTMQTALHVHSAPPGGGTATVDTSFDVSATDELSGFSFDVRDPDAFPYGDQDEEAAKFYFAFTRGGHTAYELQLKPRISGNGVRHLWTGDADHSGYDNADDSGAGAGWYTVELELTGDGAVTFSYRTLDDGRFYNIEVDNLSIGYRN